MKATEEDMQTIIERRIKGLENANANNLLEGIDIGEEAFQAILQRAKQPISDEEFVRRETALWDQKYPDVVE